MMDAKVISSVSTAPRKSWRQRWGGLALAGALAIGVPAVTAVAPPVTQSAFADEARAVGATEASNTGYEGQCTWGAKEKFFEATGLRPAIYGNAFQWADSARSAGWTVVLDAQARSIVVFQPGVQGADPNYGHVAWVDSVEQRSDGLYISITEMNGANGPFNWSTRTVKDVVGMSYILAP